jgi:AcrR family transcriptional regulator
MHLNKKRGRKYRPASIRRRRRIFSTASRLFSQKGYLATSLDDIATAASVNKASVYYYYRSKADLLYEIALSAIQALLDLAAPIADSDLSPRQKLEALVVNHLLYEMSHIGLVRIGDMERKNLPLKLLRQYTAMRDEYERVFRTTIEQGTIERQFRRTDSKIAALFLLGFANSIIGWYKPDGELSAQEIASRAWTVTWAALGSDNCY